WVDVANPIIGSRRQFVVGFEASTQLTFRLCTSPINDDPQDGGENDQPSAGPRQLGPFKILADERPNCERKHPSDGSHDDKNDRERHRLVRLAAAAFAFGVVWKIKELEFGPSCLNRLGKEFPKLEHEFFSNRPVFVIDDFETGLRGVENQLSG